MQVAVGLDSSPSGPDFDGIFLGGEQGDWLLEIAKIGGIAKDCQN
jgi:hypothetical protein